MTSCSSCDHKCKQENTLEYMRDKLDACNDKIAAVHKDIGEIKTLVVGKTTSCIERIKGHDKSIGRIWKAIKVLGAAILGSGWIGYKF